jgi:acyl-CoA thioesterase YciA
MSEPYTAIQVVMMPRDTNPNGTIFGGVLLSYIDQAGAIAARRELSLKGGHSKAVFVTVAFNRVEFKQPVMVGDVVKFNTHCTRVGRTSLTMHIDVIAERGTESIAVTDAEAVYVAIDPTVPLADRRPVPLFPSATNAPGA